MIFKKGFPLLEEFIQNELKELEIQAQKANAKPYFIDLRHRKLENLGSINNEIIVLDNPEIWHYVETSMKHSESINPKITGHSIEYNVNHKSLNYTRIIIPEELL